MKFENLSSTQRGMIFIVIGVILFFYAIGFFRQALHLLILVGALFLILYGVMLGDFGTKAKDLINSYRKK